MNFLKGGHGPGPPFDPPMRVLFFFVKIGSFRHCLRARAMYSSISRTFYNLFRIAREIFSSEIMKFMNLVNLREM